MSMTVKTLHKHLGMLIAKGHGLKPVCVNKTSFHHVLEDDGAVILGVQSVSGPTFVYNIDDDGGVKLNKGGSESGKFLVILDGGHRN